MYLKLLAANNFVNIEYENNGALKTLTGRVYKIYIKEQILTLKDEKQNIMHLRLSGIRDIY